MAGGEDQKEGLDEASQELIHIGQEYNGERLFVAALVRLSIPSGPDPWEVNRSDRTARIERLAALLLRPDAQGDKNPTAKAVDAAVELAGRLVRLEVEDALDKLDRGDELLVLRARLAAQATAYRGTAYPEQTTEIIRSTLSKLDQWFTETLGASPSQLVDALWALKATEEQQSECWLKQLGSPSMGDIIDGAHAMVPVQPSACRLADGATIAPAVWDTLVMEIGFSRQHTADIDPFGASRTRPLYVLSDGRLLMCDLNHALDCLRLALERRAKQSPRFEYFQSTKASWAEAKTYECLVRPFGKAQVYQNLLFSGSGELDVAAVWGPFLLLAEVKAKQFRLESHLRDFGRLRTDLRENVEEAFQQALRAWRYISSNDEVALREADSKRVLRIRHSTIRDVFFVTVSLNSLGVAITGLAQLRGLGLFKSSEYPWAVNLWNLDIVTRLAPGADVFLHYLKRRRQIEPSGNFALSHEADLFGRYLFDRLSFALKTPLSRRHLVAFQDSDVRLDEWMEFSRGDRPSPPNVRLQIPEAMATLIEQLGKRQEDDARWIAQTILDMSDEELLQTAKLLEGGDSDASAQIQRKHSTPQSVRLEATVFTVLHAAPTEVGNLREETIHAVTTEARRYGMPYGVGLGIVNQELRYCAWIEGAALSSTGRARTRRLKPNELCWCGSRRKLKKCHRK